MVPSEVFISTALDRSPHWVSAWGSVLFRLYRVRMCRPAVRVLLQRWEGGPMRSVTWRRILREQCDVRIGDWTRGAGLRPGVLPPGTVVGNYSCLGAGLEVLRTNHAADRFSQHPVFHKRMFGLLAADKVASAEANPLQIGGDVWFGLNVLVCPRCCRVGDGAIVGAGSVVTRDVPSFSVVAGNPAKVIRRRFDPEVEAVVVASRWWLRPMEELLPHLELFSSEITAETTRKFAEAFPSVPRG